MVASPSSDSRRIQKSIGFLKIRLLSSGKMSRRQRQIRSFFPRENTGQFGVFQRDGLRFSLKSLGVFSQIRFGKHVLLCKIDNNYPSVLYDLSLLDFNSKSQL